MRISEAISLLQSVVAYNIEQSTKKRGTHNFVVPFLVGDPGVGKTAVPRQVARAMQIHYNQVIIAQYDAGELAGLPYMDKSGNRMIRLRPSYLPDPYEKDETGDYILDDDGQLVESVGIFNMDELPQAFLANQNIASQIVNEWSVGEHPISPLWTICCTGNKPENKAGTTTMPTHLRDRLMFIPVEVNSDDFLNYATIRGIDFRVRSYIRNNPGDLAIFNPAQNSCPSPRSWEKASGILSMGLEKNIRREALSGMVGDGMAVKFEAWLRVEDKLPKLEDIIKDPEGAPVFDNKQADVLYMLLSALADAATPKNVEQILKYIVRLPNQEFAAFWAFDALRRDESLNNVAAVTNWKIKHGSKLT